MFKLNSREVYKQNIDRLILKNHGNRRITGEMNLNNLVAELCDIHWRRNIFIMTV